MTAPTQVQIIQDAANMGVLARQAIANQFPTMEVDPKICANVALLVEQFTQKTDKDESPATESSIAEMLEKAQLTGRDEAVGVFAEDKAELLRRVAELEASCENLNGRLVAMVAERDALTPPLTVDADTGAPVTVHPGQDPDAPEGGDANASGNEPSSFKGPGQ